MQRKQEQRPVEATRQAVAQMRRAGATEAEIERYIERRELAETERAGRYADWTDATLQVVR